MHAGLPRPEEDIRSPESGGYQDNLVMVLKYSISGAEEIDGS